ncbi:hypothetical protein FA95DRAFT_1609774 [Auriscalpium vulgare]|uniref:Uncharacterized protein n=1 Tax=Auriscalpium vulgare TaxID=40419 RepID=A0ACB8RG16_9AGAM|nr:hypothetical protein FA95DRAFT_1609774 [Auriscalpium vulgare]
MDDVISYLRLARMVHVGPEKEWSQRKKVLDVFVLTVAAILEAPENYQRLLDQYRVRTNRLASTPDFGVRNLINEQTVVTHLARAGYTAYEAAAASHLSHAVLTDARYGTRSQDSELEKSGSDDDPGDHGTPIVVDEPVVADGSPIVPGNPQPVTLDVVMTGGNTSPPSLTPSA